MKFCTQRTLFDLIHLDSVVYSGSKTSKVNQVKRYLLKEEHWMMMSRVNVDICHVVGTWSKTHQSTSGLRPFRGLFVKRAMLEKVFNCERFYFKGSAFRPYSVRRPSSPPGEILIKLSLRQLQ